MTPFLALRPLKLQPHSQALPSIQQTRIYREYRWVMSPLLDSATRRRFVLSWAVVQPNETQGFPRSFKAVVEGLASDLENVHQLSDLDALTS